MKTLELKAGDLFEKDGIIYEVTYADIGNFQRKYQEINKPGATNALGRVTNKGAIDITKSSKGYAKPVNSTESPRMMLWHNAKLIKNS